MPSRGCDPPPATLIRPENTGSTMASSPAAPHAKVGLPLALRMRRPCETWSPMVWPASSPDITKKSAFTAAMGRVSAVASGSCPTRFSLPLTWS